MSVNKLLRTVQLHLWGVRLYSADVIPVSSHRLHSLPETRQAYLASTFRCLQENPTQHNLSHEAQFYTISSEEYRRLFTFGGITRDFQKKIKIFSECCLMVRKPALEVIYYLNNTNFSNPVNRFVLYGVNGAGKTLSLAHILHYISFQQWLILHAPWPPMWTRLYKEVAPSAFKPGRIDHPVEAVAWLQHFKLQNSNLLQTKQPRIANSYTWSRREVTEKGSLLMDIIEQGINRPKFSSDCVGAILKEAKILASSGELRVAVVIDGVNSFFDETRIKRDDRSKVPPEDVTLIHAFMKLLRNDWTNGVVIVSTDVIASHSDKRESYLPRYLLRKKGFELMDPFVPILVDNYSGKEINSCLDYYIDRRWIQSEQGKTEEGRKQLMFLSGYNPGKLIELCGPW